MSNKSGLGLEKVLLSPIVSDKATRIAESENTYSFRVHLKATKPLIKRAIERFFSSARVKAVHTTTRGSRRILFGQLPGRMKKAKIAYVTLEEGTAIQFSESEV